MAVNSEEYARGQRLKNRGYVYVLRSKHRIKVGYSVNPESRVETLNRTFYGGSGDWTIIETLQTDWMLQVEQLSHLDLESYKAVKEIFTCSPAQAVQVIEKNIEKLHKRYGGADLN